MITRIYRIDHHGRARHALERDGEWRLVEGDIFGEHDLGAPVAVGAQLLAPVLPSKIVCVGLNYRDHAAEQHKPLPGEPMIFIKPSTCVIGPDETIVLPQGVGRVDYESEVGVVIGKRASHVVEDEVDEFIFGITCVNDVSARDLQNKGVGYTRAKGFDTFAPIGPCIARGVDYRSAEGLTVEGMVNGVRRQASSTRELIFGIPALVAFISAIMTLLPGDIVSTGTPSGVGPLTAGDRVTVRVEGVGELTNPVGQGT